MGQSDHKATESPITTPDV